MSRNNLCTIKNDTLLPFFRVKCIKLEINLVIPCYLKRRLFNIVYPNTLWNERSALETENLPGWFGLELHIEPGIRRFQFTFDFFRDFGDVIGQLNQTKKRRAFIGRNRSILWLAVCRSKNAKMDLAKGKRKEPNSAEVISSPFVSFCSCKGQCNSVQQPQYNDSGRSRCQWWQ